MFPAVLLALPLSAPPAEPPAADAKAVLAVLDAQAAAWNKGDLDGFMTGYWKDEKLTFISGDTLTQGWEPTRDRYVKRYQAEGKDKMGTLAFEDLDVAGFGTDAALVKGRFKLTRGGQTDTGRFTLVFRKVDGRWKIVHDHTSAAEKPAAKKE